MRGNSGFWWRWLVVAAVLVILFGAALVLLPSPMQRLFNLLFFGSAAGKTSFVPAVSYLEFAFAVLGSVMIGWGSCLLVVLLGPFRRGSRDAWLAVAVSLVAWFVPDTAFSLFSGFWQNAVLNTALVAVFLVPLAATYHGLRDT